MGIKQVKHLCELLATSITPVRLHSMLAWLGYNSIYHLTNQLLDESEYIYSPPRPLVQLLFCLQYLFVNINPNAQYTIHPEKRNNMYYHLGSCLQARRDSNNNFF